jgi:hypothetical protein
MLVGTEDPQLLIREYQLQRRRLGAASHDPLPPASHQQDAQPASDDDAAAILAARDRFIAQRIAATLPDGQTGLLFLGAAHRLDALRAAGLDVATLEGLRS